MPPPFSPAAAAAPGARRRVRIAYEVEEQPERWLLDEETMPESTLHDQVLDLLKLILLAWVAREKRDALVARNLAFRWEPSDARIGTDPDLAIVEPSPRIGVDLTAVRIWEPGHSPPRVGVEVVSGSTADKDYHEAPARYARLGASELWVFDPKREGPSDTGGPFVLQIWRLEHGQMDRVYAGSGPAPTPELDAWLVVTDGGTRLRIADDARGERLWPTEAEAAGKRAEAAGKRAEAESKRAEAEGKRAEAAELALAELERKLAERGGA